MQKSIKKSVLILLVIVIVLTLVPFFISNQVFHDLDMNEKKRISKYTDSYLEKVYKEYDFNVDYPHKDFFSAILVMNVTISKDKKDLFSTNVQYLKDESIDCTYIQNKLLQLNLKK